MSFRLINTDTKEVLSQYNEMPKKIRHDKLSIHSPGLGVLNDTYSLLEEIIIDNGGDVYVDESVSYTETQHITTKNYRDNTTEEQEEITSNLRESHKQQIDLLAEKARLFFVDNDVTRITEYRRVEEQVVTWQASGSDAGNIPSGLQDQMDVYNQDLATATATIIGKANYLNDKLDQIRTIRLKGKHEVDIAETAFIESVAENYLGQLNALLPATS